MTQYLPSPLRFGDQRTGDPRSAHVDPVEGQWIWDDTSDPANPGWAVFTRAGWQPLGGSIDGDPDADPQALEALAWAVSAQFAGGDSRNS